MIIQIFKKVILLHHTKVLEEVPRCGFNIVNVKSELATHLGLALLFFVGFPSDFLSDLSLSLDSFSLLVLLAREGLNTCGTSCGLSLGFLENFHSVNQNSLFRDAHSIKKCLPCRSAFPHITYKTFESFSSISVCTCNI